MTPTTEYAVGFSAGSVAVTFIFERVYRLIREQKNGNGKIHTFAQDPERYWDAMRENVTKPLSEILDRQTRILEDQTKGNTAVMLKLVQLEERTRK